jgi:hypothetical protein
MLIIKIGSSIWTKCVCYTFATLWTPFVIICYSVCCKRTLLYLWNVTCDVYVEWCDLGCKRVGLKFFVVSIDYRDYMGSSSKIWAFRRLFLDLCSYNLVGSVTTSMIPQEMTHLINGLNQRRKPWHAEEKYTLMAFYCTLTYSIHKEFCNLEPILATSLC